MSEAAQLAANVALVVLVGLLLPATYRIWTGPSAVERLQALDLTTTVLVGVIVALGIVLDNDMIIDIGIALAAFSFVGTLAIARFVSEGRFF
ncbi:MAG TPA: monovalent cation/H+ antiporter complex subunit F [Euzebyales bacterium]|nr:monovalent cation/H+ antiporter complex subunit F [Euzebyales bacterium]